MSIITTTTRRAVLAGASVLLVAGALLTGAVRANAFEGYVEPTFFGASGSGNGQFKEPEGVAVNDTSGDVYAVDKGNNRVQLFDAAGKYLSQFNGSDNVKFPGGFASPTWIAVDNSTAGESKEDVYVVDSGHNVIDKFTSAGTFIRELNGFASQVIGIADDDAGDLWVEESNKEVLEFSGAAANSLLKTITPEFERSPGIAVDSQENLYILRGEPNVAKYDKNGVVLSEQLTTCGCGTAVAIDQGNNGLFVDEASQTVRYGPFAEPYVLASNGVPLGIPIESLEGLASSNGIAVNGSSHTVYATESAGSVAIFRSVLLPDVTTGEASEIHRTSVKLEGAVNPDGQAVTSCKFEYGPTTAYGKEASCTSLPGSGTSPVTVSAEVSGLTQETTYHFRLVAGNSNRQRPNPGLDKTFTTQPAVENVMTLPPEKVEGTCATLRGSFEANGFDTHYRFEYGETEAYGSSTALTDGGEANGVTTAAAQVCSLKPHQLYHYRIVAENTFGTTAGGDESFKSAVLPPVIPAPPTAEFVAAQSAVLLGTVNPEHTITRYHFEYGQCEILEGCPSVQSTPVETSAVNGAIGVSAEITGLSPGTIYSYRLVADNSFEESGKTLGGSVTQETATPFRTLAAPVPSVETGPYAALTPTSATVFGAVDPQGVPASYTIELGVYNGAATQYGVVMSGSVGTGTAPVPVGFALTGLQPGTTYAYRVSVVSGYIDNGSHSLQGATMLFTTPGVASVLSLPAIVQMLPVPPTSFPEAPAPSPKCKKGYKLNKQKKCVKERHKKKSKPRKRKAKKK